MEDPWCIVLAGGEGTRLRALTTDSDGRSVPKQFCSLDGGPTLLEHAIERGRSMTDPERVVTIVASEHRDLWAPLLQDVSSENVIVQPRNRGTAAGILLPLVSVMARDPAARIAILPSDHFVRDERSLQIALLQALDGARDGRERVTLLGITPEGPVSDYGWILPEAGPGRLRPIRRFVEKPAAPIASELLARGGLWNSFLLAAHGQALVDLFERHLPRLLAAFREVDVSDARAVERLYDGIQPADFSRDVLQESTARLRVLEVPPCGWTDLGTPQRVAECLRGRAPARRPHRALPPSTPVLSRALEEAGPARGRRSWPVAPDRLLAPSHPSAAHERARRKGRTA